MTSVFKCPICGYTINDIYEGGDVLLIEKGKDWNYCPNCGSKMREEQGYVVSWKDFRDFLDDNAEDFDSVDKRLDVLERKLVEEAERLWETIDPVLKKQAAKRAIEQIEKELNGE